MICNAVLFSALLTLGFQGPADKDIKKKLKQKPTEDEEYDLSRFKPLVRTVISVRQLSLFCPIISLTSISLVQEQVSNKLDQTLFPYVKDYPSAMNAQASLRASPASTPPASLRSAKPSWHRAARPNASQETRQRLFLFMAGGMTYSEMREAYQLSSSLSKDIYIGAHLDFSVNIPSSSEAITGKKVLRIPSLPNNSSMILKSSS